MLIRSRNSDGIITVTVSRAREHYVIYEQDTHEIFETFMKMGDGFDVPNWQQFAVESII